MFFRVKWSFRRLKDRSKTLEKISEIPPAVSLAPVVISD